MGASARCDDEVLPADSSDVLGYRVVMHEEGRVSATLLLVSCCSINRRHGLWLMVLCIVHFPLTFMHFRFEAYAFLLTFVHRPVCTVWLLIVAAGYTAGRAALGSHFPFRGDRVTDIWPSPWLTGALPANQRQSIIQSVSQLVSQLVN